MKTFYGDLRLGILGGGQLGRMLIQAGMNYNIHFKVLDPDTNAPCKNLCDEFIVGSLDDYNTIYNFGKKVDLLTIEIEKVNVAALARLEEEGKPVYPQSRVIRLIQDKGLQKQFFKEYDIPTAEFQLIANRAALANAHLTFLYIQKLRRDGYDGRGVYKVMDESYVAHAFDQPSLIEKWVDFEEEIAVIVARNEDGAIKAFPCVEMEFNPEANLVEFLSAPSTLPFEILQRAEDIALKIAGSLKIVGLLAVEMFLTGEGEILVNELAPRPHNSGHHTIEGNYTSQFEQHLRAILNLSLGNTASRSNAVMINLLGEKDDEGKAIYEGLNEAIGMEGVYIHLYGKKFTRPFRKMGHVTIIDEDKEKTMAKARKVQKILRVRT